MSALISQTSQLITTPDGQQIEADALWQNGNPKAEGVKRVAVLCHPNPLAEGTMMNKIVTTMYRFARDKGWHVVRFNFRGVGRSTGSYGDTVGEIADTMTVLNWVKSQTNARELWLGGFSFGGYIASRVAEAVMKEQEQAAGESDRFDLTNLALIAPSIQKHDVSDLVLPTAKTFCIFGDSDELVEPSALRDFVARYGIRYKELPDTGHFFHGKLGELKALLGELML